MKQTIDLAQLIGTPNAIVQKFGLLVFNHTQQVIAAGNSVELDFSGLDNVTTGFVNASVGNLYRQHHEDFNQLVSLKGLNRPEWKEKISNALDLVDDPLKATAITNAVNELWKI